MSSGGPSNRSKGPTNPLAQPGPAPRETLGPPAVLKTEAAHLPQPPGLSAENQAILSNLSPGVATDTELTSPMESSRSPIPASTRSTLQAAANEEMEWARNNRETVFDAYAEWPLSVGGRIINGDLFVTMLPSVYNNPDSVHKLDPSDMSYLAADLYEQSVCQDRGDDSNTVLLMVGAAGVGKSTLARRIMATHPGEVHTILDSNGANWESLRATVSQASRAGRTVDIVYLGGDIRGAIGRTVSRSLQDRRVVPVSAQVNLHRMAPANFLKALRDIQEEGVEFAGYDAATRHPVDNPGRLAESDLNHPLNHVAGITSILKEALYEQGLEQTAARSFTEEEED